MTVHSADNKYFKIYKSLLSPKGIKKHKFCLVSGGKIVPEILSSGVKIHKIIATSKNVEHLALDHNQKHLFFLVTPALFSSLDIQNTDFPLLVCETPPVPNYNLDLPPQGLEVLCSLGDPSNLGALIRSCEAFSVSKVILLKNSSQPFLPKAIKSSSGSVFRVKLFSGPFISELNPNSYCALDKSGTSIYDYSWPINLRLLMGEEGPGHPKETKPSKVLSIPMAEGGPESLNAMVATSIALSCYHQFHVFK